LDTYHPDTLYVRQKGCADPWLFFEARRGPPAKTFWVTLVWSTDIISGGQKRST